MKFPRALLSAFTVAALFLGHVQSAVENVGADTESTVDTAKVLPSRPNLRSRNLYEYDDTPIKADVVIIGAGAAGLSAAWTLHRYGIKNIVILEAYHTFGGRVRTSTSLTDRDYPVSLGAAYVQYPGAIKRIVGDYVRMRYPTGAELPVFVDFTWRDFFKDYILPKNKDRIRYGCKVDKVHYKGRKVKVSCENGGDWYVANHLIATVPLPILKHGDIEFDPPLPRSLTVDNPVKMLDGFKIFIEFSEKFYNRGFCVTDTEFHYYGFCVTRKSGEHFFWKSRSVQSYFDDDDTNILEGYMIGHVSHQFIEMDDDEIVEKVLDLMDGEFDGKASEYYRGHVVQNWSKDPLTRGTLTNRGYDKPGAQNVKDKVFVAGEAFPIEGEEQGWVDSAVFSGHDAASQILKLSKDKTVDTRFYTLVYEYWHGDD